MGDWMISKKRFWGLALPIWVCEGCGHFDVIGSRQELKERAVEGWDRFDGHSPHRPWIDLVKIQCAKCGQKAARIGDVGNPWLDAGIVPYSTMGYNQYKENPQSASRNPKWEEWFPADFITECFPGQFRNWFYAILAMSTMMEKRPPFKVLLGHGLVRDQWDRPMHKSAGNAIPFEGAADEGYDLKDPKGVVAHYPPMSADLIRWLFCRSNPANNLDFGPGPAEELRSKFTLKLWNTYAFFCNYARIDGFDPAAPPVPVAQRPDIDRWILSDLQKLIQAARLAFAEYNVMAFCLKAEQFVDDKLSNWYVRRNRRRFWRKKEEGGTDKLAAYQTLYTVLLTLAKLFAPIVPFLTETMYQNLLTRGADSPHSPDAPRSPVSVHLCDYPVADESLIDEELSADMEALLRLVSLGSAARNTVKIKVRQPLAEMKVQPRDERDRRAVERFGEQICEELNLKRVTVHESSNGALLSQEIKPNMKVLGPKFGPRLKEAQSALAAAPADAVERLQAGQSVELSGLSFDLADVLVQMKAPPGWAGVVDRGTQVAIDTRITEPLKREGQARDMVRHVQELRKQAGLEMEDRIHLSLQSDSAALGQAIEEHRDYISRETLAIRLVREPIGERAQQTQVKIDGQALTIELQRAD
jgi:isoleucyl-tRNA synthetase